ncbi:hypothetical protein [Dactylosporangium sp. CA-092794]|uniref:hypothetical protein n=1 Tax=Dactylosporangium sp. CA-092794 TaxID=3239929 RepID=UPI003D8E50B6
MAPLTAYPHLLKLPAWALASASHRFAAVDWTRPELAQGERVLATERDGPTRRRVVATQHAVYFQDLDHGFRSWHRLGWEQVEHARWDAARGTLRLVSLVPQLVPDLTLRLAAPGRLPDLARERVTATTLARVPLRHAGRVAGWLSARRPVAGDAEVTWVVRLAPGVALADADVDLAIRDARAHTGL